VGEAGKNAKLVLDLKERWSRLDRLEKLLLCGLMGGNYALLGWLIGYFLA
jgi:hypothetical protein